MNKTIWTWMGRVVFASVMAIMLGTMVYALMYPSEVTIKPKLVSPLSDYSHGGHEWVLFGRGGLYHHPDCPCKDAPKDDEGGGS